MATFEVNFPFLNADIIKVEDKESSINIHVKTNETSVACQQCGKHTDCFHGHDNERCVAHLPIMGKLLNIFYPPRRYLCESCDINGVTTPATPLWHDVKSQLTYDFEHHLMLELVNSTISDVAIKNGLTEKQIQGIVDRHLSGEVDWSQFTTLGVLGIDEISLRKGRKNFITIITSRMDGKISLLSVIKGRKKRAIKAFFKSIPKKLRRTVTAVCVDMYTGYINAAKEVFKNAAIIIDRYHVAKLYRASLDKFRQTVLAELKNNLSKSEYEAIKNVTHILRRGKEHFSEDDKKKVEALFSHSFELSEAYRLALKLTTIFNTHMTSEAALDKFSQWIADVRKTKLTCFNTFIGTLKRLKTEIAHYFIERQTSGFVEGLNNKIKVLKRRCYGIFNLKHLFQRLHLDISGYSLYATNKEV